MKKFKFLMVIIATLICSISANAQMQSARTVANKMTIVGEIKGANESKITITRLDDNKVFATATAKGGKFKLESVGTYPAPFKMSIGDKVFYVALQSGRITIKGDIKDIQNSVVTSSGSHKEYMRLLKTLSECKTESDKDIAMETFMSNNSHSWISLYCLKELHKKHKENTEKMRSLLNYVKHFKGGPNYDDVLRDVLKREEMQ